MEGPRILELMLEARKEIYHYIDTYYKPGDSRQVGETPAVKKHHSGEFPYSTRDRFSFDNLG